MQAFPSLGVVVMASGLGTRFGGNKLMAPLNGQPLIAHTLTALQQAGLQNIVIVTRSVAVQELAQSLGLTALLHAQPYQSDTVALGVQHWRSSGLSLKGLLFATGDQPLLQPQTLQRLCQGFLAGYTAAPGAQIFRLAAPVQGKLRPGNPVVFSPELWAELQALPQDKGGSVLCKKHPQLVHTVTANPQELLDIDTAAELQRVQELLRQG